MDFNNHRLRRVDGDGALRTVVGIGLHAVAVEGATALMTPLENPIDFGFDAEGAIVLVAYHDPRILRVGAAGVVEVLAGTGDLGDDGDGGPALAAHFTQLAGMAVAADGRIAFADASNYLYVARPTPKDSKIDYELAGGGPVGFLGPGRSMGLQFDAQGDLTVCDSVKVWLQ
jgi:hypothetical protein